MPAANSDHRKFLVFSLHGSFYALDLAQVAEVADSPRISPIPLVPAYVSGVLNFHGDIVAVIELTRFLGLSESDSYDKMVVLHREVASLAFQVDTIIRIVTEEEIFSHEPCSDNFAAATFSFPGGEAIQLDLDALILGVESNIREH